MHSSQSVRRFAAGSLRACAALAQACTGGGGSSGFDRAMLGGNAAIDDGLADIPIEICDDISFADGKLAVAILRRAAQRDMVPIAARVLSRRLHANRNRQVDDLGEVHEATVRSISNDASGALRPLPVQVDGADVAEHSRPPGDVGGHRLGEDVVRVTEDPPGLTVEAVGPDAMAALLPMRDAMDEAGLDAMVAVSPENFAYVAGFVVPSQPLMRWRHAIAVVPRVGAQQGVGHRVIAPYGQHPAALFEQCFGGFLDPAPGDLARVLIRRLD